MMIKTDEITKVENFTVSQLGPSYESKKEQKWQNNDGWKFKTCLPDVDLSIRIRKGKFVNQKWLTFVHGFSNYMTDAQSWFESESQNRLIAKIAWN